VLLPHKLMCLLTTFYDLEGIGAMRQRVQSSLCKQCRAVGFSLCSLCRLNHNFDFIYLFIVCLSC
jgi:hypothetical protein